MPPFSWTTIQKMPEYKSAIAQVQKMIDAKVKPLEDALAEAGRAVTDLEKEVADLKAKLP